MMRVFLVASMMIVAGCGGSYLYEVRTAPNAENSGVPFLPMQSVDVEKIVYAQEWLEIDVAATFQERDKAPAADQKKDPKKDKDKGGQPAANPNPKFSKQVTAYTADLSPAALTTVGEIYAGFVGSPNSALAWQAAGFGVIDSVKAHKLSLSLPPALDDFAAISKLPRVAEGHARAEEPGAAPLYFNVKVPYGGTANGELDLAPNGTMTKGISGKQDTFPNTVVTAVGGVAQAALGALGSALGGGTAATTSAVAVPASPADSEAPMVLSVEVKLVPKRRLYTLTLTHPSAMPAADCGPITALLGLSPASPKPNGADVSPCRANVTVEVKSSDDSGDDKNKDDDKIQFSGTVKMPKAAADPGAPK